MHQRYVGALTAMVGVLLPACNGDATGPNGEQTFDWSGQVAVGDQIEIKGVNGGIEALPTSGSTVEVTAIKQGQDSDPSSVTIDVTQHAGGVTICAVYPDVPGQPANECLPGAQGNMNVQDNDVEVTFTVRVPTGVDFRGVTVNGPIEASGLASNAFATTVNGDVSLATTTIATGVTVNGSVAASLGLSAWDRDLAFTTVNGTVNVEIPASTNATVRLSTVNGDVATDFFVPQIGEGLFEGNLGNGGRRLTLTTVNGNVVLRSR